MSASSRAVPRSNGRASGWRGSTITCSSPSGSSGRSSVSSRSRPPLEVRSSSVPGPRKSATKRCTGCRFSRGLLITTAFARSDVVALSRGGTGLWYRGIAGRYIEIFDLVDPAEFAKQAAARRERGDQKQMALSEFDRDLIRLAGGRLGVQNPAVWHPGLMYRLFRAFWYGDRSLDFLLRHTDFRAVRAVEPVTDPPLPEKYVAVKFYTGPALPDTDANRAALFELVQRLAAKMPVVMLDTGWSVDEHHDYSFEGLRNVTTLRPSLNPENQPRAADPGHCRRRAVCRNLRRAGLARAPARGRYAGGLRRRSVPDGAPLRGKVRIPADGRRAVLNPQPQGAARRGAFRTDGH